MEGPAGLPTANMLKAQNFFPLDGLSLGHKFKSYQSKKFVRRLKFVFVRKRNEFCPKYKIVERYVGELTTEADLFL